MSSNDTLHYPEGEELRRPWRDQLDADCKEYFHFGLVSFIIGWNTMQITYDTRWVAIEVVPGEPLVKRHLDHAKVVEMRMRIPDSWFNIT